MNGPADPRRVLFLDVDGVLNSVGTLARTGADYADFPLDPENVSVYNALLGALEGSEGGRPTVVLSSSWRRFPGHRRALADAGVEVDGETPQLGFGRPRGAEIAEWLLRHPEVEEYLILDDTEDFFFEQRPHVILCRETEGFTERRALEVLARLADGRARRRYDPLLDVDGDAVYGNWSAGEAARLLRQVSDEELQRLLDDDPELAERLERLFRPADNHR